MKVFILIFLFLSIPLQASNLKDFMGGNKLVFSGYYDVVSGGGNFGGFDGINDICDTDYANSHACTFDEIIKLGNAYPYSQHAWVIDGAKRYYTGSAEVALAADGNSTYTSSNYASINCAAWRLGNNSYRGVYMSTAGVMTFLACDNNSPYIPCCAY